MERIRQAVEQARKHRQEVAGVADVARHGFEDKEVASKPGSEFDYTETQSVTVSPAVRENNRLVAATPGHQLQDAYRILRTRVLQEMHANDWKTIGITSPVAGAGKTLTALNLAISIARDLSHTALLFDADLRHPTVASYLGFEPEFGLNDYLFNDVPLNKVLFHPDMDRLSVLPGKEPINESAETLSSPKFISLLKDVRNRYPDRITVVDLAPTLEFDDVLSAAPNVDCILMVAESGETKQEELSKALEMLENYEIIGTVLNKVEKKVKEVY